VTAAIAKDLAKQLCSSVALLNTLELRHLDEIEMVSPTSFSVRTGSTTLLVEVIHVDRTLPQAVADLTERRGPVVTAGCPAAAPTQSPRPGAAWLPIGGTAPTLHCACSTALSSFVVRRDAAGGLRLSCRRCGDLTLALIGWDALP
jgi:hypothetical protein